MAEPQRTALNLFFSAGEASGDRQAAALLQVLRQLRPELQAWAIGGRHLREAGADLWLDSRAGAVMGFGAALASLPVIGPRVFGVMKRFERQRPDVAILVDWGGVNVRLARRLRRLGIPTLYYFPPRSWDRRARRDVAGIVDAIATPFPWSKHILSGDRARVQWVGHPLIDQVHPQISRTRAAAAFGLDLNKPIIALLPGSRKAEVRHCLPVMLEAGKRILAEHPGAQFVIAASEEARKMKPALQRNEMNARFLEGMDYDALQCADVAMAVSGTATLEVALLGLPMVVIYRNSAAVWLQYEISRRTTVPTRFFSLPNLVADRGIVTELMQGQARPERIAQEILSLLSDRAKREKMQEDLASVARQLGCPGATRRVAEMVLDLAAYGCREPLAGPVGVGLE